MSLLTKFIWKEAYLTTENQRGNENFKKSVSERKISGLAKEHYYYLLSYYIHRFAYRALFSEHFQQGNLWKQ